MASILHVLIGTPNWNLPSTSDNSGVAPQLVEKTGLTSGSSFAIGSTTVFYTSTDGSSNAATCSFNVTVTDNEASTVLCPSNVVVSTSDSSTTATWSPANATDNADSDVTIVYSKASGSSFDVGITSNVSDAVNGLAHVPSWCRL
jgi:hypothetical protein